VVSIFSGAAQWCKNACVHKSVIGCQPSELFETQGESSYCLINGSPGVTVVRQPGRNAACRLRFVVFFFRAEYAGYAVLGM